MPCQTVSVQKQDDDETSKGVVTATSWSNHVIMNNISLGVVLELPWSYPGIVNVWRASKEAVSALDESCAIDSRGLMLQNIETGRRFRTSLPRSLLCCIPVWV